MKRLQRHAKIREYFLRSGIRLVVVAALCFGPSLIAGPIGHAPDRVLLKLKPQVAQSSAQSLIAAQGAVETQRIPHIGVRVLKVAPLRLSQVLEALGHNPNVEFAEPDVILEPDLIPNDPYFSSEWHLAKISAPAAWDTTVGSANVVVAILDTGVDGTHPDLVANLVAGWNIYDNNSNTGDVYGHGTEVAGTVGASGNNGLGVASVAFGCMIMPVRISDTAGLGYASTIASGLTWAADHGARVANISYEVTGISTVSSAAQYFNSKGGVVTVSAGNYSTVLTIPDDPNLLTVSATDSSDALASWSNTGTPIDLAAPGVDIYTTTMGGGYGSVSGTSFSAPTAAGVAALVISANPGLSSSQIQQVLKQSADDLGAAGWDPVYGWGRVNAQRAVSMAVAYGQVPGSTNQIWGRVLWGGEPVSGAVVSTLNGTNVVQASTASDGTYILRNLASATTYSVTCTKTGLTFTPRFTNPLPLGPANFYGADFYADQPTLIPYTVSGQVTDPVNGTGGAEVRGGGLVTTTDATGNYQFTNFLNGSYALVAQKDDWTISPAALSVSVSSADSTGNNFARVAPYSISGCVYGVPAAATSPAPLVYLSNGSSVPATRRGTGQNRYWGYTLNNVPAGQYSLSAELPGYLFLPGGFGNPLTITGSLTSLSFTGSVAAVAGSLSGRITEQGQPVPGVTVEAMQGGVTAGSASTDSDGYYRISNLADGSYTLVPSMTSYTFSPVALSVGSVPSAGNDFGAGGSNLPPVVTSVTAVPAVVSSSSATATLSALATGSGTLTYSWDAVSAQAPVSFSANDSSGAATTTVSFQAPGSYIFRARVVDGNGLAATANANVTVIVGAGPMVVAPYQVQLAVGQTVTFKADAWDQMGSGISVSPTWTANGGGTIDSTGMFSATGAGGPFAVIGTAGALSSTGFVWVTGSSSSIVPPVITSQPLSQWLAAGSNATFSVVATGTMPLSYQWLLNGAAIAGATGSTYTRNDVQAADAGNYAVQVTNAADAVLSAIAVLTVNTAPVLSPISDQMIHAGATLMLTNQATDIDSPPQALAFGLDPGFPAGSLIDATSGVFSWSTTAAQAGTTNSVTVRVTDNGVPSLSDVKTFSVTVVAPLAVQSINATNSSIWLTWNAVPGTRYRVQFKNSLSDAIWNSFTPDILASDVVASMTDSTGNDQRFYRVLVAQ